MTHLREEMDDTYASMDVDLERLAAQAQVQGGRLRRRNRRLSVAGSTLAVVAAVGLGAWTTSTLVEGAATVREGSTASGTTWETPLTGVEALTATLTRVAPAGVVTDDLPTGMTYEPNRDGSPNALGGVEFAPSAGAASGGVIVNYWPVRAGDLQRNTHCHDDVADCEVVTLPDGTVVLTYVVNDPQVPSAGRGPAMLVAAHRVVNGNVVSLGAGSPYDAGADARADDAVLTRDQLVDVISQPEWSRLIPVPPAS